MNFIGKTAENIEKEKNKGGEKLQNTFNTAQKYILAHTSKTIFTGFNQNLSATHYNNLNIDKADPKQFMNLAVSGCTLKKNINNGR